jgi:DNA polymerase-3 subunit delta'
VWDELVGQGDTVGLLAAAAASARGGGAGMTHAWVFTGPPGSGRSVAARAFAAALQCTDPALPGCGRCHACTTVRAGSHADVEVVATELLSISTDQARSLVQSASRRPSTGAWRVLLVEDADRMVERSANVLLKAIEEPPERTVWLLCAPSPGDLPTTVVSRCRQVRLRVPPPDDVADLLVRRDGVDPAMASFAARAAQSHIGLARRLARDEGARRRRREVLSMALEVRGVADAVLRAGQLVEVATEEAAAATTERDAAERAELLRALGATAAGALPPALRGQVTALEKDQKRRATRSRRDVLDRALVDLASLYRDVLVLQLGAGVDLVNAELRSEVAALARACAPEATLRRLDAIAQARERIDANVSPLLALEAMALVLRPTSPA